MKIVFKRIIAYMIDIIIVSVISTLITSNSYINKDYNKYINTYEEYEKFYDEYEESIEGLQESLEYEAITEEEYNSKLDKLNNDYNDKSVDYNYKLVKLSIIPTIISTLILLLYFVVIQYYLGGKTLGKRIMKLRVVNKNDRKLNIFNFLLRSLILNNVLINLLSVLMIIILSKKGYILYNEIIYIINYVIEMAIVFMLLFDKNNRGLHDYIANTKVVYEGE